MAENIAISSIHDAANKVHQALIDVLLEGGGLDDVAAELTKQIDQPVIIANMAGVILAGELSSVGQERFAKFARWSTRSEGRKGAELQNRAQVFGLFVVPLVVQSEIVGLIVTQKVAQEELVLRVLEQGSSISTLALIKHQAVHEAEQRLRRDILEELLTREGWSGGQLAEQARLLGWDFEAKPVVILFDFGRGRRYSLAERGLEQSKRRRTTTQFSGIIHQAIDSCCPNSIIAERNNGFIILPDLPVDIHQAQKQAKDLAQAIVQQVRTNGPKTGYAIAGGGFHTGLDGLRRSFQEAQQALDIGTRLQMRRKPIWFDDIQLYLLFERSNRIEEVQDWLTRTLGLLVDYDRRNKTQMIETLEVFFDTNQTLQEAAHALHIHPNTLKYRLGRIEQILGQDPFKGENQLRFYLATKMVKLLR